jgi:Uncharacterized conserved protein
MKKKAPGDALAEVLAFLGMPGRTIAAIIGPDGLPMAKKADLRFEEGGALYFDTVKSSRFYGGLSMHPFLRLYAENEAGDVLRLSGKAVFTEDPAVREKCFAACPALAERFCADARPFIAYFLTEVTAEIYPKDGEEPTEVFPLPEPAGVLIGIRLKKDTEIRDRIAKVLARREETDFPAEGDRGGFSAKLYDGALFVFAEAAKALWPRMDIRPIERAAVFETYDERERFTSLAASLIGNAKIDKPEDVTYWLNRETLDALAADRGLL